MRNKAIYLIISMGFMMFVGMANNLYAQTSRDSMFQLGICDDNGFCIPQIPGMPRSKGVVINFNRGFGQTIKSKYSDSTRSGSIQQSTLQDIKIRIPIVRKDKIKIIVGASYLSEKMAFEPPSLTEANIYQTLNNRKLQTAGTDLYMVRPFLGNRYLLGSMKLKLSGDFQRNEVDDYFRSSLSLIYGKRAKANVSWGVGLNYSYNFGKQFVFPLLAYSQLLSPKWNFEALLPVTVKIRHKFNNKNILEFSNRLTGYGYNIAHFNPDNSNLFLEKSDFLSSFIYEREIHDFLWMSVSIGNRLNLKYDFSQERIFPGKQKPLISNTLSNTLFFEYTVFLVPPRKWMDTN